MNADEAKAMAKWAGGLFHELKSEGMKLLYDRILPADKISVETSLKNHRVSHEFFNWPQFMEGLRAEHGRSQARLHKAKTETIIGWLNMQPGPASSTKEAAITAHFANSWEAVSNEHTDDYGKQTVRKLIRSHCYRALLEIGWSEKDASERANECVGLDAGEVIHVPKLHGGNLLGEPPAPIIQLPQSQLEALAVVAHEEAVA